MYVNYIWGKYDTFCWMSTPQYLPHHSNQRNRLHIRAIKERKPLDLPNSHQAHYHFDPSSKYTIHFQNNSTDFLPASQSASATPFRLMLKHQHRLHIITNDPTPYFLVHYTRLATRLYHVSGIVYVTIWTSTNSYQ